MNIPTHCYSCGLGVEKPYAVWHWQSGKPARNYCFLCWQQQLNLHTPEVQREILKVAVVRRGWLGQVLDFLKTVRHQPKASWKNRFNLWSK